MVISALLPAACRPAINNFLSCNCYPSWMRLPVDVDRWDALVTNPNPDPNPNPVDVVRWDALVTLARVRVWVRVRSVGCPRDPRRLLAHSNPDPNPYPNPTVQP